MIDLAVYEYIKQLVPVGGYSSSVVLPKKFLEKIGVESDGLIGVNYDEEKNVIIIRKGEKDEI